jgi:hypothetical protein
MIDLPREANALQDAMRVRTGDGVLLHQLAEMRAKLNAFLQPVGFSEIPA